MQRGNQNARGDTHGFRGVISFTALALDINGGFFEKNRDQRLRGLKKGFVGIGAQGRKGVQPLIGRARGEEFALFDLCRLANLLFGGGIAHHHKMPRLHMGTTRGETSS